MGLVNDELKGEAAMVWLDLETTGLNAEDDIILEIAVAISDKDGNILGHHDSLVDYKMPQKLLWNQMEQVVQDMHTGSGLWDAWCKMNERGLGDGSSNSLGNETNSHDIFTVEQGVLDFLTKDWELHGFKFAMSGNSIHFDRAFIEVHMPELFKFFHYRNIDVSTVKNLCRMLNEPVADGWDRAKKLNGGLVHHRALDDIKMSINEYIFYKDNFLFTE